MEILEIGEFITNKPGYMHKIQQIIEAGVLEVKGDMAEIHFDAQGNIRKIVSPKVSIYPKDEKIV